MKKAPQQLLSDPFADLQKREVKKGTVLLLPGQRARYAYQVTKGCLRSYVVGDSGKEHILQFAPEGWYISDMGSLLRNQEASVYIDAIEDSEVIYFDKALLKQAENMPNAFLIKHFQILQNNIIASNKRLIHLLGSNAEVRYLDFISTYPSLANRLPLKLIAAYLGITPEFVSRIRKKMAQK